MKLCLQCSNEIAKTKRNYKKLKYCCHDCYASSIRGKSKNMDAAIKAAALKRKGCINRSQENANQWFWSKVKKLDNGCWQWQGAMTFGYGVVCKIKNGKDMKAHQVAFWLANNEWANNYVLHSCDNKSCVNPSHLRDGTHLDNVKDAIDRMRYKYGENVHSAKITNDQANEIRQSTKSNKELAMIFGVHGSTISRIKNNKTWTKL